MGCFTLVGCAILAWILVACGGEAPSSELDYPSWDVRYCGTCDRRWDDFSEEKRAALLVRPDEIRDLEGSVRSLLGQDLTIELSRDSSPGEQREQVELGHRFGLFEGDTYKGEAVVYRTDRRFLLCRLLASPGSRRPQVGDRASTRDE